jgi:DNA-binding MarR family transcriptional regulator
MARREPELDLGVLISRITSALQRSLAEALPAGDELGPRQRTVLAFVQPEGSRAVDLARESGQHKQVIGTLVDELEALGYVRRTPDPTDRRAKLVVPTERGRRQITSTAAAIADVERRLAGALGEQAYRQFKQSARRVAEILHGAL